LLKSENGLKSLQSNCTKSYVVYNDIEVVLSVWVCAKLNLTKLDIYG